MPKRYSIHVNGPWCITFEWIGNDAWAVDIEQYHLEKKMSHRDYLINQRPHRLPTHPGLIFKEHVLPSLGISITQAAKELSISRQTLHRILNESHPVTPAMALRFGRFCNNDPSLWLRMQQAYDLKIVEAKLAEELKRIPSHVIPLQ